MKNNTVTITINAKEIKEGSYKNYIDEDALLYELDFVKHSVEMGDLDELELEDGGSIKISDRTVIKLK